MEKSKVLISNVKENIEEVIEGIFQELQVDIKGKSVLIKPNMVGPFPPGVCTHPEVIREIVRACRRRGAAKIIVGDNPGGVNSGSALTAEQTGIKEAAEGCFLPISERVVVYNIKSEFTDSVVISKALLEVDYIINVPVLKTHVFTTITCAIKNVYGYVAGAAKSQLHLKAPTRRRFSELLTEIFNIRRPDLNIVDALTVMEGNGPTHGNLRRLDKIIAGTDALAVDATCTRMMGIDPVELPLLITARDKGLGQIEEDRIKVVGELEVIVDFKPPFTYGATKEQKGKLAVSADKLNMRISLYPILNKEKCIQCGSCETNCPARALTLEPFPVIDTNNCITCYCCVELCKEAAMEVPEGSGSFF